MKTIDSFKGEFEFLSNFFPAEINLRCWEFDSLCKGPDDVKTFPTIEHGFVFAKNPAEFNSAWFDLTPGQVKRKGRNVLLRSDWEKVKIPVMESLVWAKFTDHKNLTEKLIATGDSILIEGNWWHDQFWGDCRCNTHKEIPGENKLGLLLEEVRMQCQ